MKDDPSNVATTATVPLGLPPPRAVHETGHPCRRGRTATRSHSGPVWQLGCPTTLAQQRRRMARSIERGSAHGDNAAATAHPTTARNEFADGLLCQS